MRGKRFDKGDSQYLVFRVSADTPDFCTEDYKAAKGFAEKEAKEEGVLYEVYAKIGQAVPIKSPPPVKWLAVVSEGM
jgi:hypothetical protein